MCKAELFLAPCQSKFGHNAPAKVNLYQNSLDANMTLQLGQSFTVSKKLHSEPVFNNIMIIDHMGIIPYNVIRQTLASSVQRIISRLLEGSIADT